MNNSRIGRGMRAIRVRTNLTQQVLATRASVPRGVVASLERGDIGRVRVEQLLAVATALRADVDLLLRWNGTDLDRLLNAGHSAMHELVVGILATAGWAVVPERSFSIWGERGVIDLLAWHAATRSLLVVELKTEIVDVQRLIGTVDRYRRLAPEVAHELGWVPASVSTWVARCREPDEPPPACRAYPRPPSCLPVRRPLDPGLASESSRPAPRAVLPIRCSCGEPYGSSVVAAPCAGRSPGRREARGGGGIQSPADEAST
jgi:DNA-binding XRE family transcriptional regulator